jgi:hypothetical protein
MTGCWFNSINLVERAPYIGYGLTVRFIRNAANTPVTLLVNGDLNIGQSVVLTVAGDNGITGSTNALGKGGLGGPGVFRGGDGGYQLVNSAPPAPPDSGPVTIDLSAGTARAEDQNALPAFNLRLMGRRHRREPPRCLGRGAGCWFTCRPPADPATGSCPRRAVEADLPQDR